MVRTSHKSTFVHLAQQGYFNVAREIQNSYRRKGKHKAGIIKQYYNNFCLQEKKLLFVVSSYTNFL